jgi:hypothetical protein
MPEAPAIPLTLPRHAFKALLQRGVGISGGAGATVREFLEDVLGIDATYVEEKLQTVFLDGQPVDDLDRAVVRPGAVLALSGAMPGLAGATMRRGGYYARMREGITHEGHDPADRVQEDGIVVVKLFNRPLADLAETLAARPLLARHGTVEGLEPETGEGGWVRLALTLA